MISGSCSDVLGTRHFVCRDSPPFVCAHNQSLISRFTHQSQTLVLQGLKLKQFDGPSYEKEYICKTAKGGHRALEGGLTRKRTETEA